MTNPNTNQRARVGGSMTLPATMALLASFAVAQDGHMAAPHLVRGKDVLGAEVRDRIADKPAGEKVGKIKDLAVETGSGRVVFAIVTSGGVLGLGAKERVVAVPGVTCTMDRKDAEKHDCTFWLSKAEFDRAAEFDDKLLGEFYHRHKGPGTHKGDVVKATDDPYLPAFAKAEVITLKGKITSVSEKDHHVVAEVAEERDGASATPIRVVLGPDTYVKSKGWTPAAGERIEVDAVSCAKSKDISEACYVATSVKRDGATTVQLRERSGQPLWNEAGCFLASKIDGCKVKAANEKLGSVKELYLDPTAGQVAFVTVSADGGDLVIPFGAATFDKDCVMSLNQTPEQLKAAPRATSKDVSDVDNAEFRTRVYKFYAVPEPNWGTSPAPDKRR